MDVLEDSFAVTDGDAPLEHTRNAALVQLVIDDGEGFGPARYAPGICQVIRQFPVYQLLQVWLRLYFFDRHDLHQVDHCDLCVELFGSFLSFG
jgi:hypothetical protein